MTCPKCGSGWNTRGLGYTSCGLCGFVFTRAASDKAYADRLRAEVPDTLRSNRRSARYALSAGQEAALRHLNELREGA